MTAHDGMTEFGLNPSKLPGKDGKRGTDGCQKALTDNGLRHKLLLDRYIGTLRPHPLPSRPHGAAIRSPWHALAGLAAYPSPGRHYQRPGARYCVLRDEGPADPRRALLFVPLHVREEAEGRPRAR